MMVELDVPYFRQTALGSCGPACLMMVLKYHRPEMEVSKVLEFKAWLYAQLFPFGMTDAFGLAGFAAVKGFRALVVKEKKRFGMALGDGDLRRFFVNVTLPLFRFNYERIRYDALRRGVSEVYGDIDVGMIERFVYSGRPPIVMVDQTRYAPEGNYRYGMLHWVVVTGVDSENVKLNDPDLGRGVVVPRSVFERALDLKRNFRMDRRLVIVDVKEPIRTPSSSEPRLSIVLPHRSHPSG